MIEVSREVYWDLIKTLKVLEFVLIGNFALVIYIPRTVSLEAFQKY